MAWAGYIGLGTVTNGVFTESAASGYARIAFTFGSPFNGKCAGTGSLITFATVAGTSWTFNAAAFYAAATGPATLVYPHTATQTITAGNAYKIAPAHVVLQLAECATGAGMALDAGGVKVIAGLVPQIQEHSATAAITAHAGGGQGSAVPLTTTLNVVSTVGTAADSVLLPPAVVGAFLMVTNSAASNSMNVFPSTGDNINALSANAAYAIAAGKSAIFSCAAVGTWNSLLSA